MEGIAKEDKSSEPGLEVAIRSYNFCINGFFGQARQENSDSKKPKCCGLKNKRVYS